MATRFAISAGNYSNPAIWDDGIGPLATDDVYSNGFNIAVDTNINAVTLRNIASNVYLPAMSIPAMTGNTQPSGTAFSTQNPSQAYLAFNQAGSTWSSLVANVGTIGYTFTSTKYIVRYYFRSASGQEPTNWTFQGSNDNFATAGVILHTGTTGGSNFVSPIFTNTVGYTSYRLVVTTSSGNNICNIRQFEMTENAGTTYGAITSGTFNVTNSKNITLSGNGCIYAASNTIPVITCAHNSPDIVNITSTANKLTNDIWTAVVGGIGIKINGTGTVNATGDLLGTSGAPYGTTNIFVNAGCTLNYIGNMYGAATASSAGGNIYITSGVNTAIINVTGNLFGSTAATNNFAPAIYSIGSSTINITGNLTAYLGAAVYITGASIVNIIGTVNASNTASAFISTSNSGMLNITTPIINNTGQMAIVAYKLRLNNAYSSQWVMQDQANANRTLYNGTGTLGMPLTTNVRYGTVYGQSSEYTGALRVPNPNTVALGVLTDNTTGTAVLTAEDFLNAISTSSNVVATRLKNVSTVQTTGDQLAAFTS